MKNRVHFRFLLIAALFTLSACGFHMRGTNSVSFQTMYLQDSGAPSIARDLKRSVRTSGVKLVDTPEKAQISVELLSENGEKRILSLSGNGRVREFEIYYRVVFRVRQTENELWGPSQTIEQKRDFTYDDSQVLAKEGEETRLNNDMRTDVIREILRRVSSLSKNKPTADQ